MRQFCNTFIALPLWFALADMRALEMRLALFNCKQRFHLNTVWQCRCVVLWCLSAFLVTGLFLMPLLWCSLGEACVASFCLKTWAGWGGETHHRLIHFYANHIYFLPYSTAKRSHSQTAPGCANGLLLYDDIMNRISLIATHYSKEKLKLLYFKKNI